MAERHWFADAMAKTAQRMSEQVEAQLDAQLRNLGIDEPAPHADAPCFTVPVFKYMPSLPAAQTYVDAGETVHVITTLGPR